MKKIIISMLVAITLLSCSKQQTEELQKINLPQQESFHIGQGCSGGCNESTGNGETGCGEAIASWATDCKCWQHTTTPKPPCSNPPCN